MSLAPRSAPGLGQRPALSPRLSESLRILALPTTELSGLIETALESNPLLEAIEPTAEAGLDGFRTAFAGTSTLSSNVDPLDELETSDDLYAYLARQLAFERLSTRERTAALTVIDALDEDGYLRTERAALVTTLSEFVPPFGEDEIETAIRRVQQLEPTGVAARSAAECLLLQLDERAPDTPGLAQARCLIARYCEALARPDHEELARRIGCNGEELAAALALIHSLDPYPGYRVGESPVQYLVPDLIARPGPNGWRVEVNSAAMPPLQVNEAYAAWLGAHRGEPGCAGLVAQLEEAQWLLRSLRQRQETLLRVGRALVARQSGFLAAGAIALQPLTRGAIAEELGLHESTVARAVQHKSLAAPRGIFPLRNFFSAPLSRTLEGGEMSAAAAQAQIGELIAAENPALPLSDAALAAALAARGTRLARRTVAKYREAAGLPSARSRKRCGPLITPRSRGDSGFSNQGASHAKHDHRPASRHHPRAQKLRGEQTRTSGAPSRTADLGAIDTDRGEARS